MADVKTTTEMDDAAITAFLDENRTGVLSLSYDGDAYAIPETYGFDGERIYFKFGYHDESKKIQYLGHTDRAAFVVYDTDNGSFRSVIATGPVRKTPEERVDHAITVLAQQGNVPDVSEFTLQDRDSQFAVYTLDIETISGRQRDGDDVQ